MRKRQFDSVAALIGLTTIKVRFSEVDSMKVVWHGEYVKYFEDGREAFGHQYSGLGYMDIYQSGYSALIVKLQVKYLKPLTINDEIIVETRYIKSQAAKICFEYIIRLANNNEIVARGRTEQVFVDRNGVMLLNKPPFYEKWIAKWIK